MISSDFHIHTTYCDGISTPEEVVLAAIDKGLECIGFSAHSYTSFDESYCIKKDRIADYKGEISALADKYKNKLRILCGIEKDFYSDMPTDAFDYTIGSVHYLKLGGDYIPVDENADILISAAKTHFGGDFYSLAEEYFRTVSQVRGNIIGHLDIISKFNEKHPLFDEGNERYIAAYKAAIDALMKTDTPFEINTGAISRGYKTKPYPSPDMLRYICSKGGKVILSSDSHSADTLAFGFPEWERIAKELGLKIEG